MDVYIWLGIEHATVLPLHDLDCRHVPKLCLYVYLAQKHLASNISCADDQLLNSRKIKDYTSSLCSIGLG